MWSFALQQLTCCTISAFAELCVTLCCRVPDWHHQHKRPVRIYCILGSCRIWVRRYVLGDHWETASHATKRLGQECNFKFKMCSIILLSYEFHCAQTTIVWLATDISGRRPKIRGGIYGDLFLFPSPVLFSFHYHCILFLCSHLNSLFSPFLKCLQTDEHC